MRFPWHHILPAILLCQILQAAAPTRPWTEDVIYFVLTDRFLDGDPTNNIPAGSDQSLYDPSQERITAYHGGDLRGLEKALSADYFNDLGITALWLSPVVTNTWGEAAGDGPPYAGYHGYWTQDFLDIDPHLASETKLDGTATYPPGIEGRMAHYRDFIRLAHSNGIKVIQDVVLNHSGANFFYDANGNGSFDIESRQEWTQPFRLHGHYENATWGTIPGWNLKRTAPAGNRTLFEKEIPLTGVLSELSTYSRKGFNGGSLGVTANNESMTADFYSLRTLDTSPDSPHFDRLVDEFVTIYHFYLGNLGVDGLRIDTVKHVHHPFWDAFTSRLREKLGPQAAEKILFGEIYDGDPAVIGRYTYRSDWPRDTGPCLDSALDFDFCFAARDYLRHAGADHGTAHRMEKALLGRTAISTKGRHFYNSSKGPDGLNSQDKIITFIENHDSINRFRARNVTESRHRLAQALVLTLPGIPCLYYGAEFALHDQDGRIGRDGETGRMTFFRKRGGPSLSEVKSSGSFQDIARLTRIRAALPFLRTGAFLPLWVDSGESSEDDGLFVFARSGKDGKDFAIIVMNPSEQPAVAKAGDTVLKLPASLESSGRTLSAKFLFGNGELPTKTFPADQGIPLVAPPSSLVIYLPSP